MPLLPILAVLLSLAAAAEPIPAPPGPDGAPMVLIPAGEFLRGSRTGEANEVVPENLPAVLAVPMAVARPPAVVIPRPAAVPTLCDCHCAKSERPSD